MTAVRDRGWTSLRCVQCVLQVPPPPPPALRTHFLQPTLLSCHVPQVRAVHDRVQDILNAEYEASRSYRPSTKDWLASHWQGFMSPAQLSRIRNTGLWGTMEGTCKHTMEGTCKHTCK